jgi:Gram-negative bacterial TonB protein C-terminal
MPSKSVTWLLPLSALLCSALLPATAESVPGDPKALMLASAKVNGLSGANAQPWHVKASFRILDENGNASETGSYEEWWAAPNRFKRSFISSRFSQIIFGTENGLFRSGQREEIPFLLDEIHHELANPMLNPEAVTHSSFLSSSNEMDGEKLRCLILFSDLNPNPGRSWCLKDGELVLRRTSFAGESVQVVHDRPLSFQGRFVAGDLWIFRAGKLASTAHVESIEPLDPVADLHASPDAQPLHRRINVSAGVAAGLLQYHPAPVYPPFTKESGTVALDAVIGVDGHVLELKVISGPRNLQQPTVDAVRTWTYRAYLLNNEPIEVVTRINVVFSR